jgi:hypothetical protein
MPFRSIPLLFFLLLANACAVTPNPESSANTPALALPDREQTVGFFNQLYRKARATEQQGYNLMYGIRDGVDSFIYDVQKE